MVIGIDVPNMPIAYRHGAVPVVPTAPATPVTSNTCTGCGGTRIIAG